MNKEAVYTYEEYKRIIEAFSESMQDYLCVIDCVNSKFYISSKAVSRFALDGPEMVDLMNGLQRLVHPDDFQKVKEDLEQIFTGRKTHHNSINRLIGRDGEIIWINCIGHVQQDENGNNVCMIGCINEVGKRSIADNVSGLISGEVFWKKWDNLTSYSSDAYILRFGIDDFKSVNEKLGVAYGDKIMNEVADCITRAKKDSQEVYRTVSDEFVLVDYGGGNVEEAKEIYYRVRELNDMYIERMDYAAVYTLSAGLITGEDIIGLSREDIQKLSHFTLSCAKYRGKNQLYLFKQKDYDDFLRKRAIMVEMRRAVSQSYEGFELYFQPIMRAHNTVLYAAESLLRFTTTTGEKLSPVEFIPILEESGLIIPIGRWIIDKALAMCARIRKSCPEFKVSVNLSYVQVLKSNVYEDLVSALERYGLSPECLIVEMTESGYAENTAVRKLWDKLRSFGVMIAIDDFGTGYSNLQMISSIMPNIVKLDRSFTVKAMNNLYEHQMMDHIIQMIHSIDLKICVEGVETQDELNKIMSLSADCIQGYYYGKPCSLGTFIDSFISG